MGILGSIFLAFGIMLIGPDQNIAWLKKKKMSPTHPLKTEAPTSVVTRVFT